jgi:hypothetical protein
MDSIDQLVKPATQGFTRWRWLGASIIFGFFLGFVDTLLIAALLGTVGIKVPAYVGFPTTFSGYFFAGMIVATFAPPTVLWEIPAGILVCALALVMGLVGIKGHGVLSFILHFLVIPALAVGVCYGGVLVARRPPRKGPEK